PVGVWRELRRISNAKKNGSLIGPPAPLLRDATFESARFAADNGIYRCYLEAMGGALATRAEHPIKLAHLVEPQANCYGEDIKRLMGLQSGLIGVKTRLQGWEVVPLGTFEATRAAGQSTHSTGAAGVGVGLGLDVGVLSGGSPAPWSSDNNCTHPSPEGFAEQLMVEQWGLSPFSIGRLRAGGHVCADGFELWLENGQLQWQRVLPDDPQWLPMTPPSGDDGELDPHTVPDGDADWSMLVELCTDVYDVQGHAGAHAWIELLPQPYKSAMWAELEKLDAPQWREDDIFCDEWEPLLG
ncbi:MAG: replication endonuclease, partial [Aeromonas sp.]